MDASLSGSSNPLASKGSCEDTAGAKECGNRRRAALVLLKRLLVPRELLRLSEAECYYLRGGGKGGGGSQEISAGAAEGEAPPSQVTASQSSGKASPKATRRSCCAASVPGAPFQAGLPALPFSHPLQFVAVPLDCPRAARRVCQCSSEAEAWLRGAGFAASCSGRLRSRRWRPEREALASSAHKASLSSTAASSSYKCEDCGKWRLGSFYPCYFPVDPQSIGDGSARDVGAFLSLVAGCGSVRARFGVDVKCVSASGEERVSCSEEDAPLWKGAVRVSPCFAYASNERLAPHFELQACQAQTPCQRIRQQEEGRLPRWGRASERCVALRVCLCCAGAGKFAASASAARVPRPSAGLRPSASQRLLSAPTLSRRS